MEQFDSSRRAALEQLFLASLPQIESIVRLVARRHRLTRAEEDDFGGEVKLRIIEHDYRVLDRFEGKSSVRTFLITVIQRLFFDYRRKLLGKWRPSADAVRRGPLAMRLETLLYRDGLTVHEAIEVLRTNFELTETVEQLRQLAHSLPFRPRARQESEEALADVDAGESARPEVQVEGAMTVARVQALVAEALEEISPQDRLLLRLRFEDNVSVANIARLLKLDQKRLYRRMDAVLGRLRTLLQHRGLEWQELSHMIERGQCHLLLPMLAPESRQMRPSTPRAEL